MYPQGAPQPDDRSAHGTNSLHNAERRYLDLCHWNQSESLRPRRVRPHFLEPLLSKDLIRDLINRKEDTTIVWVEQPYHLEVSRRIRNCPSPWLRSPDIFTHQIQRSLRPAIINAPMTANAAIPAENPGVLFDSSSGSTMEPSPTTICPAIPEVACGSQM